MHSYPIHASSWLCSAPRPALDINNFRSYSGDSFELVSSPITWAALLWRDVFLRFRVLGAVANG